MNRKKSHHCLRMLVICYFFDVVNGDTLIDLTNQGCVKSALTAVNYVCKNEMKKFFIFFLMIKV